MGKVVEKWLTSMEVRKFLKISSCDLAHLREEGAIGYSKNGNAYLYSSIDAQTLRKGNGKAPAQLCSLDIHD